MTSVPDSDSHGITPQAALPLDWSLADLQNHLGNVPLHRIRLNPPPGYATEEDLLQIHAREDRLYELEHGVLVEKPMGWYESILAAQLILEIGIYLRQNDLGQVLGANGSLKILPGIVKIPDVSFISWSRFPNQKLERRPIPNLVPDLAVEVLSESNTDIEMATKLERYFEAGVKLVWYIDAGSRTATSYTSPGDAVQISHNGKLDGGEVLPGFRVSLDQLFAQADRQSAAGNPIE